MHDGGVASGGERLPHQPALDGLRGAAVAGVLLFHGDHLRGGYLGVDVFFVLSGFLITSLLLAEAEAKGDVALGRFWSRRARRLLPALAGVLAAIAVYAAVLAKPDELSQLRSDALATIAYVANWRQIVAGTDYWALFRTRSPLEHTWSLAIEEQFYVVWPLVLAALVRARGRGVTKPHTLRRRVLVVAGAGAVASYAAMAVLGRGADPSRAYFGTDTRLGSILVGAGLAAILAGRAPLRRTGARVALDVAGITALAVTALLWTRIPGSSPFLYSGGFVVSAATTAVLITSAVQPQGLVRSLLSMRPLRLLGLVSYGVYLWHWPIYVVLDGSRTGLSGWTLVAVRIAVTLVIAVASYHLLEQPIRRGAGSPRRLRVAVPAIAVALVALLLAVTTGAEAPRRLVADPIRAAPVAPPVELASVGQAAVPSPRILLVGNSVSLYAGDEGFKALTTSPPLDVLNLGSVGCRFLPEETRYRSHDGPLLHSAATPCRDDWPRAVSTFRPDVVVLLFAEPSDNTHEIDGRWTEPCKRAYDEVFERELEAQTRLLASTGATVVVSTAAYTGLPATGPTWMAHNDCQNAIIRRVVAAQPGAVLVDVFSWICQPGGACASRLGGVELRPDGVHFRDAGARLLARRVLDELRAHGVLRDLVVEPDPPA